jgi:thioredoxin reductase
MRSIRVEHALYRKNGLGLSFSWRDSLQTPPVSVSGPFHFVALASVAECNHAILTHRHRESNGLYQAITIEVDYVLGESVIVATSLPYGLLDVGGLSRLQGSGVYYSTSNVEARLRRSSAVHVVGAGNSAGQAAMFPSQTACEVSTFARGRDLRKISTANRRPRDTQ